MAYSIRFSSYKDKVKSTLLIKIDMKMRSCQKDFCKIYLLILLLFGIDSCPFLSAFWMIYEAFVVNFF